MERNGKEPITKGASIEASAINPRPYYGLVILNLGSWTLSDRFGNGGMETLKTIDGNIKRDWLSETPTEYVQRTPLNRKGTYIVAKWTIGAFLRLFDGDRLPVDGGLLCSISI